MKKDIIATKKIAIAVERVILSTAIPPIIPTVMLYLAISINILPASFRLSSCFIMLLLYQKIQDLTTSLSSIKSKCLQRTDHWTLTNNKGFSLVELLVAMVLATIVGMAGYVVFSSSNWSYKVQEDVSETQQNLRVAMDRLAKDIRMAGFGLPETPSLTFNGLAGTFIGQAGGSVTLTSPITVSANSTINPDTITILGIGFQAGTLSIGANIDCNDSGTGKICLNSVASTNNFFTGEVVPYTYQPNRRYISLNGTTFIELANAQIEADRSAGKLALGTPATLDRDYQDGTPVYIIQAVQYSISNTNLTSYDVTNLRGSNGQTLAENIEDIQFAYGIDADDNGVIDDKDADNVYENTDYRFSEAGDAAIADPSTIIAVRSNIVARTRNQDTRTTTFTRQCLEDRSTDNTCTNAAPDGYRRRVLTKVLRIRNPG